MAIGGDFLVIGSGVAGLRAALSLAEHGEVLVLTKAEPTESNTGYAQGGIAAALGPDDSPELHARDTVAAGDGLCSASAVTVLVEEGPRYVRELIAWGAGFDRDASGAPALGREAAHSVRRVLHARDATGREIGRLLWSRVSTNSRIHVLDDAQAVSLQMAQGVCVGANFVTSDGTRQMASATRTLLATGGAGHVFRETTNPAIATGDGVAMAALAGARVTDLEFVQFHPTVLSAPGAARFLLSEALRGEGARLVNADGEAFMTRYEPAGDLASRDLVARAIVREVERTGRPVYLSVVHLDPAFVRSRFPTIVAACAEAGLDLTREAVPVSPAAHYVMGGVETDLDGRTSVEGLFAAGEVACTGVHGANRLASNSLLEGLVFGARAAQAMAGPMRTATLWDSEQRGFDVPAANHDPLPTANDVRDVMWRAVGLVRDRAGLTRAVEQLTRWSGALRGAQVLERGDPGVRRLHSIVTVGLRIARAALYREESRGGHYRSDFPSRDDARWQRHIADVTRVSH